LSKGRETHSGGRRLWVQSLVQRRKERRKGGREGRKKKRKL
jgi:hypothetical protein